jgi:Protein of unknown function (DUF3309)
MSLATILLVVLIVLLFGTLPTWGHSRSWGYGPALVWGWWWCSAAADGPHMTPTDHG